MIKIDLMQNVNKKTIKIELLHHTTPEQERIIIIKIYYLPNTEYNPYKYDSVIFYIEINDKNNNIPRITCHSRVNSNIFYFFIALLSIII